MTIAQFSVPLDRASLQSILRHRLLKAIVLLQSDGMEFSEDLLADANVPVHRLHALERITYQSAIAFKLAGQSPQQIAYQLAKKIQLCSRVDEPLLFELEVTSPGWINFYLSDRALASWLQQLPVLFNIPVLERKDNPSSSLFGLQYVHARCCSLLRLAHQQELISLNPSSVSWRWLKPDPIPWASPNFQLVHPAERSLIAQLLQVTDTSYRNRDPTSLRLVKHLSHAILRFERNCQIFGDTQANKPMLSQARLGLLAVAQFLLRELLQKQLLTVALEEL